MIQFENPFAFLLLFLIPFLYVLRWLGLFSRISFPLNLCDWNGECFEWHKKSRVFLSFVQKFLIVASFVFTVIALSDPVVRHQEKVFLSRGADIIFVVDVSPSMASKDIAGLNRLDAAKKAIHTLAESDEGDSLGVIIVAKEAAMVVPPTMDRTTFFSSLDKICVGELGDGTALGTGLSSAVFHLENSNAQKKCIILITDGENNSGVIHPNTAARLAAQKNIDLYILGVGTKGDVPLEYTDPKTGKNWSGTFESNYDSSVLLNIAFEANGKFYEVETLNAMQLSLSSVTKKENVPQNYNIRNRDEPCYSAFLFLAAIMIVIAWIIRRLILQEIL